MMSILQSIYGFMIHFLSTIPCTATLLEMYEKPDPVIRRLSGYVWVNQPDKQPTWFVNRQHAVVVFVNDLKLGFQ